MADYLSMSRSAVLGAKTQVGKSVRQLNKSMEHNATLQKAVNSGSTKDVEVTSGLTNPYRVHEGEKYDFMEKVRDRLRSIFKYTADTVSATIVKDGVDQLKTKGGFTKADVYLKGTESLLGVLIVKMGQLKSYGWKLTRITEGWTLAAKNLTLHSGTVIKREAPMLSDSASIGVKYVHADYHVGDFKSVVVQDEIHRVADAFGLDAKYLTALLKAAATIHAQEDIEIASGADMRQSAESKLDMRAGVEITSSSPLHTFSDGAGGTITMTGGIINFNPTQSAPMTAHVTVESVETVIPADFPRQSETTGQYEGVLGHDTLVV